MSLITNGLGSCIPLWKGTNNSGQTTAPGLYVYLTLVEYSLLTGNLGEAPVGYRVHREQSRGGGVARR